MKKLKEILPSQHVPGTLLSVTTTLLVGCGIASAQGPAAAPPSPAGNAGLGCLPKVDDWSQNYLLNLEAGIDTPITTHWSLRVVFQDQYASQPANGRKCNDLRLLAGTAYKF